MSALRPVRTLAGACASYAQLAWWGLVSPRLERDPLVVLQAVVRSDRGVLLAVRSDLRGWELPGGELEADERPEDAVVREVREETGAKITVVRPIGTYERTGFRPHTAHVFLCDYVEGPLRESLEVRAVDWFAPDELPETLFPWYRAPLEDAFVDSRTPIQRREHQGLSTILDGLRIDLRMRFSDDRAGRPV